MRFLVAALAILLAGTASSSVAQQPQAQPSKLPAKAFGALPFLTVPEISPDGRFVAARAAREGRTWLIVIDTESALPMKRATLPKDVELMWLNWVGDRVLVSVAIPDEVLRTEVHRTRLLLFDPKTETLTPIARDVGGIDADNVIHRDPQGKFILLSASENILQTPSVWRIDMGTLKSERVVRNQVGVRSWFADTQGVVRAGLGVDNEGYWLVYRSGEDERFRRVVKGKVEDDGRRSIERFIPIVGSDKGYVIADRGTGRFGLYRYDFTTATIGEPVFEHQQVDVDGFTYDRKTGDLASVRYTDDRDRVLWLEPDMKTLQVKFDQAVPDAINRVVSRTPAGDRMIVRSTAAHDPGTYFLFDRRKMQMSPIARPYAELADRELSRTQSVSYRARDGLQIPAYLTLPAGRTAKSLPLIMMPHGGPFARDEWGYSPWVQFLANRGYVVLQPNFRGSTGYGRSFAEAGYGEFGRKMQDDLDDGVSWLVSSGTVDPKRVCMMGASYGGYASMWASVRNPTTYRCAISFAGVSDLPSMLSYDRKTLRANRYYQSWRDKIRGEDDFNLGSVSPLRSAEKVSVPLLIAHGTKDRRVPLNQSSRMHDALTKAGKPHEYVAYDGEGHGFEKEENSIDFLTRVDAFLAKHNPAD
jgi:dienelactone hydrolase